MIKREEVVNMNGQSLKGTKLMRNPVNREMMDNVLSTPKESQ